jgi:hypothetical protein
MDDPADLKHLMKGGAPCYKCTAVTRRYHELWIYTYAFSILRRTKLKFYNIILPTALSSIAWQRLGINFLLLACARLVSVMGLL